MLVKLGGVLVTNFLAWIAMAVLSILLISEQLVFPSIESYVSLAIFPINSLVNPLIYQPDTQTSIIDVGGQFVRIISKASTELKQSIIRYVRKKF